MPQQKRQGVPVVLGDVNDLASSVKELFPQIMAKIEHAVTVTPPLFKSGVELIEVKLKAGSNIEFSITIAGKDAPKVGSLTSGATDPAA